MCVWGLHGLCKREVRAMGPIARVWCACVSVLFHLSLTEPQSHRDLKPRHSGNYQLSTRASSLSMRHSCMHKDQ